MSRWTFKKELDEVAKAYSRSKEELNENWYELNINDKPIWFSSNSETSAIGKLRRAIIDAKNNAKIDTKTEDRYNPEVLQSLSALDATATYKLVPKTDIDFNDLEALKVNCLYKDNCSSRCKGYNIGKESLESLGIAHDGFIIHHIDDFEHHNTKDNLMTIPYGNKLNLTRRLEADAIHILAQLLAEKKTDNLLVDICEFDKENNFKPTHKQLRICFDEIDKEGNIND